MSIATDVTVAIATRERPAALRRCLQAVLAGSMIPAEVLVVDQSEGNATASVVSQLAAGTSVRVVHVRQHERGLSRSRNAALAHATRPVLAVTDDDCVPDVRWVEVIARELTEQRSADVVTGRVLPLGPEVAGRVAVSSRTSEVRQTYTGNVVPWVVGTGGNFAAHREWLTRVGAFDVRLGAGSPGSSGEDMDVLYRLLRAGARIRYEPDAIVYHERQPIEQRVRSRWTYGRGMGACCALWVRNGEWFGGVVLMRWLGMRLGRFGGAIRARDRRLAREEIDVLRGTAAGIVYGLRVRGKRDDSAPVGASRA